MGIATFFSNAAKGFFKRRGVRAQLHSMREKEPSVSLFVLMPSRTVQAGSYPTIVAYEVTDVKIKVSRLIGAEAIGFNVNEQRAYYKQHGDRDDKFFWNVLAAYSPVAECTCLKLEDDPYKAKTKGLLTSFFAGKDPRLVVLLPLQEVQEIIERKRPFFTKAHAQKIAQLVAQL